jgi:hypothetical protein
LVKKESNWGQFSQSIAPNQNGTIDYGLTQLNSRYIDAFEETFWDVETYEEWMGYVPTSFDVMNGNHNLFIGFHLLKDLHNFFGCMQKAVMAYNTGTGNVINGAIPNSTLIYARYIVMGER